MLSEALQRNLLDFRHEREWEKFHTLRTLSASLCLESAELLEITQWTPDTELEQVARDRRLRVEQEVADIVILLTYLVHDLGINLEEAVQAKLLVNAKNYPVEESKGSSMKYDELQRK